MAIQEMKARFTGISPLLQNNPQTVDPFNKYAKAKAPLNKKRAKTEEDILELRRIETESKVFWDDELKVYIPARWVMASIAKNAYKIAKVSKDAIRGAVFIVEDKLQLDFDGRKQVKKINDISKNEKFHTILILPQRDVRLAKSFPIFHKWSFECSIEYDDKVIDHSSLINILEHGAKYGGYGDFRPTYGRAFFEEIE